MPSGALMLTSISNDSIVNAKEVLNRKAYILEVIMMVAILALAIILSRALTRPFNRVTQAINAVKEASVMRRSLCQIMWRPYIS